MHTDNEKNEPKNTNALPRMIGPLINGRTIETGDIGEVRSPYDGALVAVVNRAGPDEIEQSIVAAVAAFEETRRMPAWRRSDILEKISVAIAQRREEFARTMALEAGKPLKAARVEVDRAVFTFKIAA